MIKYSKFTDNIESGNFTDIFCQNTNKFQKSGAGGGGGAAGCYTLRPPLDIPFFTRYNKKNTKMANNLW